MTRRALGTLSVLLVVVATAAWVRPRAQSNVPEIAVRAVAAIAPTTTLPPTTTTLAPKPVAKVAAAPRVVRPVVPRAPLPPAVPALTGPFEVASAMGSQINVYRSPQGELQEVLQSPNKGGNTQVLLVKQRIDNDWFEAYMPTRPNQHTGFVRYSDVAIESTDIQIKVERGYHRLTAWQGGNIIAQEPVAIGQPNTPTPAGVYYLQMLVKTPNANGAYGPFVFGLSAHSDVYENFGGGDGLVGLHGTNQPSSVGRSASHGCLRVSNAAITRFRSMFPLGTPIVIV